MKQCQLRGKVSHGRIKACTVHAIKDHVAIPSQSQSKPSPRPPSICRTCREAVIQARQALRLLRDSRVETELIVEANTQSQGQSATAQPNGVRNLLGKLGIGIQTEDAAAKLAVQSQQQIWASIELPLPVKASFLTSANADEDPDLVRANDEGDWPGGIQQRFKVLKPLVEMMLEGYEWKFLGLVESPADGVGVWSTPDMTIVGTVTNPTFPSLLKLLEGGYGSRVAQPGHMVVAVNPMWTSSVDIGQPWDRALKDKAAVIMGEKQREGMIQNHQQLGSPLQRQWDYVYMCRMVRTSQGSSGLLHRSWPHDWKLHAAPIDNASELGPCVLSSSKQPSPQEITEALAGSKQAMASRRQELQEAAKQGKGIWPW